MKQKHPRRVNLIVNILNLADVIAPLLAMIAFLWKWQKLSLELRLVLLFCVVQFVCNSLASTLAGMRINNYAVYIINTFLSFVILFFLFTKFLIPLSRSLSFAIAGLFIIFIALLMYKGDGISTYNSTSAAMASLIIVALSLYFFYSKLINTSPEASIPGTAIFWCVIGIFTYFAGSFFIFITYKYMIVNATEAVGTLWRFHNLLLLICSTYFIYGILCKTYRAI